MNKESETQDMPTSTKDIKEVMERYRQAEDVVFTIAKVADHCRALMNCTLKLGAMTQPPTDTSRPSKTEDHTTGDQQPSLQATRLHEQATDAAAAVTQAVERQKAALEAAGGMEPIVQLHRAAYDAAKETGTLVTIDQEVRGGKPCIRECASACTTCWIASTPA